MHFAGARIHAAVGVKAFRILPVDHHVEGRAGARRQVVPCDRRADVGKQVQTLAQLSRRVDPALLTRRIVKMGHRAKDQRVSGLGCFEGRIRQGRAGRLESTEADIDFGVFKTKRETRVDRVQNNTGGDLGSDPVAGQEGNFHI